ncbi:EAL domain-containing protein [Alteromonas sp. CYL-A6]|uniref:EAL domain-containing protein n=1 Tax=Alteromonas nitratireducens TaxID=3390813 RepID=UPI0034B97DC0
METRTPFIAIGASAGGLEALSEFFRHIDKTVNAFIVVAQHLSPNTSSMLHELLGRHCQFPVQQIVDGMKPKRNTVLVTPPNFDVIYDKGHLLLLHPDALVKPKPSINQLLDSLSCASDIHPIGIILSGTGSDGAQGLIKLKAAGGVAIAQEPGTAKYNSMPLSAIATGIVDHVLSPQEIATHLPEIIKNTFNSDEQKQALSDYYRIIVETRRLSGLDLTQYKTATIERQIQRRMKETQCHSMYEYAELLSTTPSEVVIFTQKVLIPVTEFFRDKVCFEALKQRLSVMVKEHDNEKPFRVWVPACATGEEAYSITMLLLELRHQHNRHFEIKIFGTDLDANALSVARKAKYPTSSLDPVPRNLINKYFVIAGKEAVLNEIVKSCITFSRHNVIQDPPFSHIDVISCRNLLIYFTPKLQQRVLETFHYSLNEHGTLFLGQAETTGDSTLFTPVSAEQRTYKKVQNKHVHRNPALRMTDIALREMDSMSQQPSSPSPTLEMLAYKSICQGSFNSFVVINQSNTVIYTSEESKALLSFNSVTPTLLITDLLPAPLCTEIKAMLLKVRRDAAKTAGIVHSLEVNGTKRAIQLQIFPLYPHQFDDLVIILVDKPVLELTAGEKSDQDTTPSQQQLQHELEATKESLRTVIDELDSSNEELQALNEELQSSNEELQATNEELQTTNEELQSTNEELCTVNDEVIQKNFELEALNSEMHNLYQSANAMFLILDADLNVKRADPKLDNILRPDSLSKGKYWKNLDWKIPLKQLEKLIDATLEDKKKRKCVTTVGKDFYLSEVSPFIVGFDRTNGVVLSFTNITELQQHKLKAETFSKELEELIDANPDGVIAISKKGIITQCNSQAAKIFGYLPKELIGQNVSILMPEHIAKEHDDYLNRYARTGEKRIIGVPRRLTGKNKTGQLIPLELHIAEFSKPAHESKYISVIRDITLSLEIENKLKNLEEQATVTLENIHDAVIRVDNNWHVLFANHEAESWFHASNYRNKPLGSVMRLFDPVTHTLLRYEDLPTEKGSAVKVLFVSGNNEKTLQIKVYPFSRDEKKPSTTQYVLVIQDITLQEQVFQRVEWESRHDPLTELYNRSYFMSKLSELLTRLAEQNERRSHILMFIDLDQFKVVNDTAGHEAGDELLKQLAQELNAKLRDRDILARLGGDEFVLLIENCPVHRAQHIAGDIIQHVEDFRFSHENKLFRIGASIGITRLHPYTSANEVLSLADHACYQAKEQGRNNFVFMESQEGHPITADMLHIQAINDALEHNRFEFYLQQIAHTHDENKNYWEVLLRLRNQHGELVSPGSFLPIAERFNLIHRIDEWVMKQLSAQLKQLVIEVGELCIPRLSINMSAQSLSGRQIASQFKTHFSGCGLPYSHFTLEVTETAAISHYATAKACLDELSKLGVKIAIDDFGSGMASFNYIRKLPIDVIKIDGSIVKDIENDILDATLVESIQSIAEVLDCETVAEFVESAAIHNKIKQLGVNYMQGYFVKKPISWSEWTNEIAQRAST